MSHGLNSGHRRRCRNIHKGGRHDPNHPARALFRVRRSRSSARGARCGAGGRDRAMEPDRAAADDPTATDRPRRVPRHGDGRGRGLRRGQRDRRRVPALSRRPSGDRGAAMVLAGRGGGHRRARRARGDRARPTGDARRPLRIHHGRDHGRVQGAGGAGRGQRSAGDARVPPERRVHGSVRLRARDRARRRQLATGRGGGNRP